LPPSIERAEPAAYLSAMQRWLITLGILLVVAGLLWPLLQKLGFGRLPGDFVIERGNFRLYLPLGTCILISIVLSLLFWLLNR
jgi:Protein of unknown function (DUF2905)